MSLKQFALDYQQAAQRRNEAETGQRLEEARKALQILTDLKLLTAQEIKQFLNVDPADLKAEDLSAVLMNFLGHVDGVKILGLQIDADLQICLYYRRHLVPDEVLVLAVDGLKIDPRDERLPLHPNTSRDAVVTFLGDRLNAAGRLDFETGDLLPLPAAALGDPVPCR